MKKLAIGSVVVTVLAGLVACSSSSTVDPASGSGTSPGTSTGTGQSPSPTPSTTSTTKPVTPGTPVTPQACDPPAKPGELYELSATTLVLNQQVSMCDYRGKVALFVNVASYCGNTPQYAGLQNLYRDYGAQGFVVLGFPSNQFGSQEPGSSQEIKDFCEKTYQVEFPMFEKIYVNGPNTHPIYNWLKAQPGVGGDIEWNFAKFLVGRDGKVIKRFGDTVDPESTPVVDAIKAALSAK